MATYDRDEIDHVRKGALSYDPNLPAEAREALRHMQALSSRIAIINEVTELVNRNLKSDQILKVVRQYAKWLLDYDHLSVCLRDENGAWTIQTLYGVQPNQTTVQPDDHHDPLTYVLRTKRTFVTENSESSQRFPELASQLIVPLIDEDEVAGALIFAARAANAYTLEDIRISYLLALQLGSALRNAAQMNALKRAEETLRAYARQLEMRNDELDWFNAMIAHDLKAPLAVIYGYISLLDMRFTLNKDPDGKKYVGAVYEAAQGMNQMIERLLELARMHHEAEARPVDVIYAARSSLNRFKHTLEHRPTKIDVVIDDDLPRALGYPAWIEEIFANLIGNAIKYIGEDNPAPRVQISAVPVAQLAGMHSMTRYEVRDNGVGMSEEQQQKLFKSFSRVDTRSKGHGLGLYIVRRFVTQLGGEVGITSAVGAGSTFWFTLPSA
jgi:signal transduction histidine kinase